MRNLDSILKSRDITLPTKVCLVKATVFPVVMYGCESLTLKKVEHRRIDASELWCWRRLLRVPWTARRSNQSILKEFSPEFHWKDWCWSSNTLATWCEDLTHLKRPWCWERLKAGGEGDNRGWDSWMESLTHLDRSLSKLRKIVKDRISWRAATHRVAKSRTWLGNWTTTQLKKIPEQLFWVGVSILVLMKGLAMKLAMKLWATMQSPRRTGDNEEAWQKVVR